MGLVREIARPPNLATLVFEVVMVRQFLSRSSVVLREITRIVYPQPRQPIVVSGASLRLSRRVTHCMRLVSLPRSRSADGVANQARQVASDGLLGVAKRPLLVTVNPGTVVRPSGSRLHRRQRLVLWIGKEIANARNLQRPHALRRTTATPTFYSTVLVEPTLADVRVNTRSLALPPPATSFLFLSRLEREMLCTCSDAVSLAASVTFQYASPRNRAQLLTGLACHE